MSSPGQKHGGCGHLMASFDTHSFCARCREKSKGPDPCVSKSECQACGLLTEDQRIQLPTPSYRIKKEKRDLKKIGDTPQKNSDSSSLIDPSSVTVMGAVEDQGNLQSPGSSSGSDKKKKDKKTKPGKSSDKPSKSVDKPSRSSTDSRIDELDKKWADRFNRLEALLLAKSIDQPEPTFQAPKVAPTHPPPVSAIKSSAPFIRPSTDQPTSTDLSGTGHSTPLGQPTSKSPQDMKVKRTSDTDLSYAQHSSNKQLASKSSQHQPPTGRPSDLSGTDPPAIQVTSKSTSAPARDQSPSSMDTGSDSDSSDRPPVDLFVEEGELSDPDQDPTTDPDQILSEEQNYRETLRGIRSYMGWTQIPDIESTASTGDDNPFAGPHSQPVGKVSVRLPTDDWLCNKMAKLNITLVEGYPSRSSEAEGLLRDQFVRPPKSQLKWYELFSDQKSSTATRDSVTSWSTDASKLNSSYSRIARAAGIAATPPPSRQITHDNLRRWEKSAREASTFCNQAAGFNRCLLKVQENMQGQLKSIRTEITKGKCSSKFSNAVEELQYLTDFNSSISQAMAKTMEHLSDFVFVTVANSTLARRDSYLSSMLDTLASLRTAPLQMATLFPDEALK